MREGACGSHRLASSWELWEPSVSPSPWPLCASQVTTVFPFVALAATGLGKARSRKTRAGWRMKGGRQDPELLSLMPVPLSHVPLLPSLAAPVRSPELPMPTALLYGAWGLGSTEVPIVAGWPLRLTCRAEEVGPGD